MKFLAKRGFTMIEAVVVSAIIVVLASLLVPAFAYAKKQAKLSASISNLRQLHVALTIYRQDHETNGVTEFERLGLPGDHWYFLSYFDVDRDLWKSPCGFDKTIFESSFTYVPGEVTYPLVAMSPELMVPGTGNFKLYNGYLETWQENSVALIDNYCNAPGTKMFTPMVMKRELCILLSGQLVNRMTQNALYLDLKPYSDPYE